MDILHREGRATATDVRAKMEDPPTDSAVRSILRILREKGIVDYTEAGRQYVYRPRVSPERAKRSALRYVVETFFGGSPGDAVEAFVEIDWLSEDELDRLAELVERARKGAE